MNERLYCFKFEGQIEYLTLKDAIALNNEAVAARIDEILLNSRNKKMVKDGFEPGIQANINEYCGSKGEYDRRLRELGLIELGYDTGHIKETTTTGGAAATEEFAFYAKEIGIELNDQEIDAIKSGEYFSDDKCDISKD